MLARFELASDGIFPSPSLAHRARVSKQRLGLLADNEIERYLVYANEVVRDFRKDKSYGSF